MKLSISSHTKSIRVPRKKIAKLVAFVARAERAQLAEVDIAIVGSRKIAAMNLKYLNHSGVTDIITFDQSDPSQPGICCQLVICADVARKKAEQLGCGIHEELLLYVTHGLLHMTSYDDTTAEEAEKMYARQEYLIKKFLGR